MKTTAIISGAICLFSLPLRADEAQNADKSQYNLFNPVPKELLRDLTGDRPDGTESATTVDPGYLQIEASTIDYSRNKDSGTETEVFTFGATNVRIGLLEDLELQVVFDIYAREEVDALGVNEVLEGFGDVTLRPKFNIWGNEGGKTALAIMPAIKIPTGTELSNNEWEGGIIVPFSVEITDRLGLGLMGEVDWVHNGDDYDVELFHTAVLGYALSDRAGAYIEYIGIAGEESYQPHISGGLTYLVNDNLMLDVGAVAGLNDNANDLQVFTGFTVRF